MKVGIIIQKDEQVKVWAEKITNGRREMAVVKTIVGATDSATVIQEIRRTTPEVTNRLKPKQVVTGKQGSVN